MSVNTGTLAQHPYLPPEALLPQVKEEQQLRVEHRIIVNSQSPLASPMLPVRKPNGKIRVCVLIIIE